MKIKIGFSVLILMLIYSLWPQKVQDFSQILSSPNSEFWFGTDSLGRDLFSRLAYGSRVSLLIGFLTSVGSLLIALFVAVIALRLGGVADQIIMRVVDILMALPSIVILSILILALKNIFVDNTTSSQVAIISLALISTSWVPMARQIRTLLGASATTVC